jgi:UTP--glucose-1-phosphate uridylyltransferase
MVYKAVIPAAGFGTRFLPATKSQPKEMLPIVDTPTIQYVVQEAIDSGINDILMIIGKGKRAIEEHFDKNFELEYQLEQQGKKHELNMIRSISSMADIHFVWQKEQNGLGDAIKYAKKHVGNEPFAVLLGDTVLESHNSRPVTKQLIDVYERFEETVIALEEIAYEKVHRYGVISGNEIEDCIFLLNDLVEKPLKENAPSNLVIASRYILTPDIFDFLDNVTPGKNNEIQLTDALKQLISRRAMYGVKFSGERHDMGNKLDFLRTTIQFALKREDIGKDLKEWLHSFLIK